MSTKMILQTFSSPYTCKARMLDMLFSQSVNGPDFPVRSVSHSKTCKQGKDA